MNEHEQKAILTLSLMAAFADGNKDESERAELKRIADALAGEASINLAALYQDVLLKRVSMPSAVAALTSPEARQLAFEMAVCVCDADGVQSAAEQAFLADLRHALALDVQQSAAYTRQAEAIAALPVGASATDSAVDEAPAAPLSAVAEHASTMSEAEMEKAILNAAILNGALELLPESLSTMAIIPLQMKLVYRIGKSYGFELDRGHIKDFLATLGVGLTSQYLEQAGRKLLGGLLGKVAGKTVGKLGGAATGMAFSFATTYALGQLARRYYAGGRTMNTVMLRDTFQSLLGPAKQLQTQYLPQIQQKAATLDAGQVMAMIRNP